MERIFKLMKKISEKAAKADGKKCWIAIFYQPKCPSSLLEKE